MLNLVNGLDRSRFTPEVVFLEDGPFVKEVTDSGIEAHVIDAGRVRQLLKGRRAIAELVRLIKSRGVHIVHTWNAKSHVYGGLAAAVSRVPSVYHLQGVPKPTFSRDGLVSFLSVALPARRTLACSAYVAEAFKQVWHSRREVVVIHNATSGSCSTTASVPSVRQEFGVPDGAGLTVMAARLQRWKGVHVFIDAVADVIAVNPKAFFIIVGGSLFGLEEEYAAELREQVERMKLTRSVRFAGFRSDINRFYAAADVVVHCSIEPEPFGMVLVEAMVCEKPVVATDFGGPREIVERDVTGLLVPPNDPPALARAILLLLGDPDRRLRMGRAGAKRVRDFFRSEQMARQVEDIYQRSVDWRALQ